jgi:hypothetical protein
MKFIKVTVSAWIEVPDELEMDRVERTESALLGLPRTGLLRVQQHAHACTSCSRGFRCTTPSCVGRPKRCVCCMLDAIGGRARR